MTFTYIEQELYALRPLNHLVPQTTFISNPSTSAQVSKILAFRSIIFCLGKGLNEISSWFQWFQVDQFIRSPKVVSKTSNDVPYKY